MQCMSDAQNTPTASPVGGLYLAMRHTSCLSFVCTEGSAKFGFFWSKLLKKRILRMQSQKYALRDRSVKFLFSYVLLLAYELVVQK